MTAAAAAARRRLSSFRRQIGGVARGGGRRPRSKKGNVSDRYLYATGFAFNLALFVLRLAYSKQDRFFAGYAGNPWACGVVLSNSLIGVSTSTIYKYGDALLSRYAMVVSAVVLIVVEAAFFGARVDVVTASGSFVVVVATAVYLDVAQNLPAPAWPFEFPGAKAASVWSSRRRPRNIHAAPRGGAATAPRRRDPPSEYPRGAPRRGRDLPPDGVARRAGAYAVARAAAREPHRARLARSSSLEEFVDAVKRAEADETEKIHPGRVSFWRGLADAACIVAVVCGGGSIACHLAGHATVFETAWRR